MLPNLTTGAEVVIPMTQMKWLLEQPDHVLNQNEVNSQFLHANRTMLHPHVIRDTVHGHIIRREMTKDLDKYAESIVDEMEHSLSRNWGRDENGWIEVPAYDTMLDVIARISNRVLVGLPLCRNEDYLRNTSTFARNVVITAGMINLLPPVLRPLLAPVITAYDMYHYHQITKHIFPIIKERIKHFKPGMDYRKPEYSEHNDYIQWALHDAFSHDDPNERTPEMITKRLTVLSFAAIQSSVITITNALFDIASSPRCAEFQQALREEVADVTSCRDDGQKWSRASLASMVRVDSALRESMRLWGFISRGVMKKVVDPKGVTLPSGEHLPFGSKVGVTSYAVHHDESVYKNALEFNALRFSDDRDEADKNGRASLVASSDHFMAFSHGRHAWYVHVTVGRAIWLTFPSHSPGRFFAANQLKLLLAQIVTKYEIAPITERPANPWLNNTVGPPMWSKLRIRRRPFSANVAVAPVVQTEVVSEVPKRPDSAMSMGTESPDAVKPGLDPRTVATAVAQQDLAPQLLCGTDAFSLPNVPDSSPAKIEARPQKAAATAPQLPLAATPANKDAHSATSSAASFIECCVLQGLAATHELAGPIRVET